MSKTWRKGLTRKEKKRKKEKNNKDNKNDIKNGVAV